MTTIIERGWSFGYQVVREYPGLWRDLDYMEAELVSVE